MQNDTRPWSWRWKALGRELGGRALEPIGHPTFIIYFVFIVVALGGLGPWIEVFRYNHPRPISGPADGLITSLVTFFFALSGSSCTQLIIEESENKAIRALAAGIFVVALGGATFAAISVEDPKLAIWLSGFASVAALVVWWIANAKSPGLKDPDTPTGGSLETDLPGNFAGYTTE